MVILVIRRVSSSILVDYGNYHPKGKWNAKGCYFYIIKTVVMRASIFNLQKLIYYVWLYTNETLQRRCVRHEDQTNLRYSFILSHLIFYNVWLWKVYWRQKMQEAIPSHKRHLGTKTRHQNEWTIYINYLFQRQD